MSDTDPDPQENTQPIPPEPPKQSASPTGGTQSPKNTAGKRNEKVRRPPQKNKFTNRTQVARAMEQLMAMMMSGDIVAEEMRALLLVLKSISDQLPKGGPVATTSISDRLRARLKDDDELLSDLADLLPGDLLDDLTKDSGEQGG